MSQGFLLEAYFKTSKQSQILYEKVKNLAMDNLLEDYDKLAVLKSVTKLLETTLKNERLVEEAQRIVLTLQNHDDNSDDENDKIANIKMELNALINSLKDPATLKKLYSSNSELRGIHDLISELQGNDTNALKEETEDKDSDNDDDIKATQQDLNLIDPFTKKPMVNPVRHTLCGHVYDKESTLMIIKQRKRKGIRCPTIGCQYRKPINAADLEEALDYKREIKRRQQAGIYPSQS